MKTNEEIRKIAASVPDSAFVKYQPTQAEAEPELPQALSFLEDSWRKLRKNKAAVVTMILLLVITALAFSAPVLSPFDPNEQHLSWKNLPPKWPGVQIDGLNGTTLFRGRRVDSYELAKVPEGQCFLFGTDEFGRDLLSRCLWGTRISLIIAFIAALLDLSIGIAYGLFSGMKGGRTDTVMQRTLEILSGIPSLVLGIPMARVVRAETLKIKQMEYVQAAKALGASNVKIALSHILPNISGIVIVRAMFSIPTAIFFETFLSFLGVGMRIPNASIGTLLNGGYKVFKLYPYQMFIPALILCVIMLSFNLFADGLRDVFDPKMKEG